MKWAPLVFGSLDSSSSRLKIPFPFASIKSVNIQKLHSLINFICNHFRTNAVLVVDELDFLDVESLLLVQTLLLLENALVEELLQLLVAVVDAELLKTVHGEVF